MATLTCRLRAALEEGGAGEWAGGSARIPHVSVDVLPCGKSSNGDKGLNTLQLQLTPKITERQYH